MQDVFHNDFNYSYWEKSQYFKTWDVAITGSGIVGLSTAISILESKPRLSVLILERGFLPEGASTKNAGFACFGSAGELLADLQEQPAEIVFETVKMRWKGLELLRKRVGDANMDYQQYGGFELFYDQQKYEHAVAGLEALNRAIKKVTGLENCYTISRSVAKKFPGCVGCIKNQFEGQIDTGKMMHQLMVNALQLGAVILNNVHVNQINESREGVNIDTSRGMFSAKKAILAVNGFFNASFGLRSSEVKPARAQVLITSPVKQLHFRGAFHMDDGYYYFRNIGNRVLFGGGRNLDFAGETTTKMALNPVIQAKLDQLLHERILPGRKFTIDQRWTGIMGVGPAKKPIIAKTGPNTISAVRLGGMGIAIGSLVGAYAARLTLQK